MFKVEGKVYEGNKVYGYVIKNDIGTYIADKEDVLEYCKKYYIDGIRLLSGRINTDKTLKSYKQDSMNKLTQLSLDELTEMERPNPFGIQYVKVPFFGEVTVKAKINAGKRLLYIVELRDNRAIIVTKDTLGKLGKKGYTKNCKISVSEGHADGFSVITNAPYVAIEAITVKNRVVYELEGDIDTNKYKDGYILQELRFDVFNRLARVTIDQGPDGGVVTYGALEYRKLSIEGATWSRNILVRGSDNKYPLYLDNGSNMDKLIASDKLSLEVALDVLGSDKVIVDKQLILDVSGVQTEGLEDCIQMYRNTKEFISKLSESNLTIRVQDSDEIECIGMCATLSKGKLRPMAQWNVIFKFNGDYILLPYNVVTRSSIQKKIDLKFNELKVYDIGYTNSIKGYREYDIKTGTTVIELLKL